MRELHDMMERSMLESLTPYIMYGSDSTKERIDTYEIGIDNSYKNIFDKLECLFPLASRHDDELYGAVLDFAVAHDEIFLEMGILVGFNMCKNLENGYQELEASGFREKLLEWLNSNIRKEK